MKTYFQIFLGLSVLTTTFGLLSAGAATGVADLSLSVSTAPQYPQFYSNIVYTITVSNAGPSTATGVIVSNQIPTENGLLSLNFISASDGSTTTNGVLLMNLGSLAVGATASVQISGLITTNLFGSTNTDDAYVWFTNVFQVFANQTDPIPTNNTGAVIVSFHTGVTIYTTSTRTIETNLAATVSQQATNYSTRLIAVMPWGTVLYDQTFTAAYSDPTVQTAVTLAAGDLTGAGASSYTGPTETNFLQTLTGSSSVTVTNLVGVDTSFTTSLYIGPQTIMVSANQSEPFFVAAGQQDYDTLVTAVVTNLVATTNTSTYLNSSTYVMTGIVGQADLSLSAVIEPYMLNTNLTYIITVSNAGPSAATGVVVSNQIPLFMNFTSATGGSTPTNGILLIDLGSLAAGATNSVQITGLITSFLNPLATNAVNHFTNMFEVFADQADPDLTNNTASVISEVGLNITTYTSSTHTIETNFASAVNQQATNYSTELIAVMPNGTVVFTQTLTAPFSDPTVQTAVATAATDLTNAGASSYTGPTETSLLQNFEGSSSVTVTNVIGTNVSFATTEYVGPQMIMVDTNQSESFIILPGDVDFDTLVTTEVTNLVTTTVTSNYLAAAVYMMTGLVAQADLSIITNSSPDPVVQNTNGVDVFTLTYSFTVSNAGPVTATGVVVSNQLPYWAYNADATNNISATGGSTPTNGILLINLGSLAAGATSPVQVVLDCYADTPLNGVVYSSFTNVFQVSAGQPDPVLSNNSVAPTFSISRTTTYTSSTSTTETNLTATVDQQATNYSTELIARLPDGTVVYDQTFSMPYSNATVQSAITIAAGDLTGAGASSYTGPTQTSFLQDFQGNSSVTVTNVIGTNVSVATTLYVGPQTIKIGTNQSQPFFIPAGGMDFDTLITFDTTNLVTTTVTSNYLAAAAYVITGIVTPADLSIRASAAPQPVMAGSNLVYTLTVENLGPAAATGVTVSNQIPANVTFVYAAAGATPPGGIMPTNGVLLLHIGSLPTNSETFAQVIVQPTLVGKLTNVFQVFADRADPTLTNNTATVVSTVTNGPPPPVDLALNLQAAPNPVNVGAPLTYSLTITNNSLATATGVMVSNTLPPNVTLISVLPSQGSASNNAGVVTYTVGTLPNGAAATLAIVVVPNAAGWLTNSATAFSAQTDSQPANNCVTNVTAAVSAPITNLVLMVLSAITMNPQTGLFEQRIEVSNGGPATPSSVLVRISGLATNATLYNATGKTNGTPFVQSAAPLGVGSNVVFLLEYYVSTRVAPTNLTLTVEAGPVMIPPVVSGTILNISRTIVLADGSVLVEFSAVPGQVYAVQYSSDMQTWLTAVPAITAPANVVQWIDAGPPQTASNPAEQPARYYRVVLLTAK